MNKKTVSVLARAKGALGDFIVLVPIGLIVSFIFTGKILSSSPYMILWGIIVTIVYDIFLVYHWRGQSIGKKFAKTRIVSMKGKLTLKQLAIRQAVAYIFPSLNLIVGWFVINSFIAQNSSWLMLVYIGVIIFNRDHRGIHDLAANTKVVVA